MYGYNAITAGLGSPAVRAIWARTGESAEWIAARTNDLLGELGSAFGVESWVTHTGARWAADAAEQAEFA